MFNKKQFRILIIALAVLFIVGSIYFAIKNKTQGGSGDDGTLAFTTLADDTGTDTKPAPPPGPSGGDESEGTAEGGSDTASEETQGDSAETPEETDDPQSESPEETPAADDPESESAEETPAETTAETAAEETSASETAPPDGLVTENGISVSPDGEYTDKEHVALYIHAFGELPQNYITKEEAEDLGWVASLGNLWKVAPGKSIGGSHFGNYEKLLPTKKGRKYYECDIDYKGKGRGAKRIIYSNDGLIFYTSDHYESFEQLY